VCIDYVHYQGDIFFLR